MRMRDKSVTMLMHHEGVRCKPYQDCIGLWTVGVGHLIGKTLPPEWDNVIVATGPLTSPALADAIHGITGANALAFFDALAPSRISSSDFGIGQTYVARPRTVTIGLTRQFR